MKGLTALALLLVFACALQPSPTPGPKTSPTPSTLISVRPSVSASPTACGDPRAHIYHPDRLLLLAPCATVKGVIVLVRLEPDGDDHIRLRVDPGQTDPHGGHWTTARNDAAQGGALVLEPVCEHTVTQADAVSACTGYHNPLVVPPVGTHVVATGPWVLDQEANHGWLELHPLVRLDKL